MTPNPKLISIILSAIALASVNAVEDVKDWDHRVDVPAATPTIVAQITLDHTGTPHERGLWHVSSLVNYYIQNRGGQTIYVATKICVGTPDCLNAADGTTPLDEATPIYPRNNTVKSQSFTDDFFIAEDNTPVFLVAYVIGGPQEPTPIAVAWGNISARAED